MRTLAVRYNARRARGRSFAEGVADLTETAQDDWEIDGPRTVTWLAAAFVSAGLSPIQRHFWWRQILGLSVSDVGVDEHHFLSQVLEVSLCFDQLNIGELQA